MLTALFEPFTMSTIAMACPQPRDMAVIAPAPKASATIVNEPRTEIEVLTGDSVSPSAGGIDRPADKRIVMLCGIRCYGLSRLVCLLDGGYGQERSAPRVDGRNKPCQCQQRSCGWKNDRRRVSTTPNIRLINRRTDRNEADRSICQSW